jgi:hypothetical protein
MEYDFLFVILHFLLLIFLLKLNVQVVGLSGLILQQREEQTVKGQNYFSLDLSAEKIGFYLIRLQTESKSSTSKILIQS